MHGLTLLPVPETKKAAFITPQLRAVYDAVQADDLVTAKAEWLRNPS